VLVSNSNITAMIFIILLWGLCISGLLFRFFLEMMLDL
jgi:hypothetical protein